jgi:ATP/ADP translocase
MLLEGMSTISRSAEMRCIAGLALFIALYFSSCTILAGVFRNTSGAAASAEELRKYHALLAVGAGAMSLVACTLPGILAKKSREAEWREWEEWNR